jgi:hypothetical protein
MTNDDDVEIRYGGHVRRVSRAVANRMKLERHVISAFVRSALAGGYLITINNGEDCPVKRSTSYRAIMRNIMQTDEEHLIVRNAAGERVGWVFLVYGNDGWDVISDYSTALEPLMAPVHVVTDQLAAIHRSN